MALSERRYIKGMVLNYDINNDNDFRLASKMAMLADGMEETSTVVAICLGSTPDREKRNPEEAAENICRIADQIVEEVRLCQSIVNKYLQGLTCIVLGLIPVLSEEVRGAYSSCWSSQVRPLYLAFGVKGEC